ncbi:MAG: NUDIX hydrolase [Candidatus Baldrarchaeota archaeon]
MHKRLYPENPIVGIGAVIVKGNKVLLIKRAGDPGRGLWSIPGGLVELGEKIKDAVCREVKEETGLDVRVGEIANVTEIITRDEEGKVKYHFVIVDFFAEVLRGELKPSSDALEAKWVEFKDLRKYRLTETVERLFKKLGFLK